MAGRRPVIGGGVAAVVAASIGIAADRGSANGGLISRLDNRSSKHGSAAQPSSFDGTVVHLRPHPFGTCRSKLALARREARLR